MPMIVRFCSMKFTSASLGLPRYYPGKQTNTITSTVNRTGRNHFSEASSDETLRRKLRGRSAPNIIPRQKHTRTWLISGTRLGPRICLGAVAAVTVHLGVVVDHETTERLALASHRALITRRYTRSKQGTKQG